MCIRGVFSPHPSSPCCLGRCSIGAVCSCGLHFPSLSLSISPPPTLLYAQRGVDLSPQWLLSPPHCPPLDSTIISCLLEKLLFSPLLLPSHVDDPRGRGYHSEGGSLCAGSVEWRGERLRFQPERLRLWGASLMQVTPSGGATGQRAESCLRFVLRVD